MTVIIINNNKLQFLFTTINNITNYIFIELMSRVPISFLFQFFNSFDTTCRIYIKLYYIILSYSTELSFEQFYVEYSDTFVLTFFDEH
jgi:hypothetical protein